MVFNGDSRSFMYYKNQYYINGTIVEISDTYQNHSRFNGKKIWKYARFDHRISGPNGVYYFFCITNIDSLSLRSMNVDRQAINEYASYFTVPIYMLDNAIGQIIKPIKLSQNECEAINIGLINTINNPKSDCENPELLIAWIAYVIVLIASLIFRQFYLVWIVASFIFFGWRKGVIKQ